MVDAKLQGAHETNGFPMPWISMYINNNEESIVYYNNNESIKQLNNCLEKTHMKQHKSHCKLYYIIDNVVANL